MVNVWNVELISGLNDSSSNSLISNFKNRLNNYAQYCMRVIVRY